MGQVAVIGGASDGELIAASQRGERAAFGKLVARYQDVVCAVSYSTTGDWPLSEDVAQDTFIAAWRQLGQLRETARLRPWLCGIARNLARKARRRGAREREHEPDDVLPAPSGTPFEQTARAETEQVVRDALARIPDGYREALVLFYREGCSVREVADVLGISEAAALQRLTRGRRHLADGVTDLVERSLRAPRRTRYLVGGVLAALPVIATASRVDASPHKGSTMLKFAFAAAALVATGTTAYIVHRANAEPAPAVAEGAAPPTTAHATDISPRAPSLPAARSGAVPTLGNPVPGASLPADQGQQIPAATLERLHLLRGPSRGPVDAPVEIVVFQDMNCPYCGKALATIDQLFEDYPNKLRLVVKQFPVHTASELPAEALFAADAQDKFWELHDLMMAHQDELDRAGILDLAQQAGMNATTLAAALDQHRYEAAVAADIAAAKEIDVHATPTFLINGREVMGAFPVEVFRSLIDETIRQ